MQDTNKPTYICQLGEQSITVQFYNQTNLDQYQGTNLEIAKQLDGLDIQPCCFTTETDEQEKLPKELYHFIQRKLQLDNIHIDKRIYYKLTNKHTKEPIYLDSGQLKTLFVMDNIVDISGQKPTKQSLQDFSDFAAKLAKRQKTVKLKSMKNEFVG